MGGDPATVESFDPLAIDEGRYGELTRLHNAVQKEIRPDDPARPVAYFRDLYTTLASATEYRRRFWWARDLNGVVVGVLTASVRTTGDNDHVLHVELLVEPEARRRGLGRALVQRAADAARAQGQSLVIGLVTGKEPLREQPGGRFLWSLGVRPGLEHRIYRLQLDHVDPTLLRRWQEEGAQGCPDVTLDFKLDPFEEEELVAVSRLMRAMNGAPRGDLKTQPRVYTPHSVAERDRHLFQRGFQRAVLLAWHRSTGMLIGYTMMLVDPYDPRLLQQADTAVEPSYRGHGLGKWVKAAMLGRMMHDFPRRSEVRTGNADGNEAMLGINRRLGFRPWLAHSVWQVSIDTLLASLGDGPGDGGGAVRQPSGRSQAG